MQARKVDQHLVDESEIGRRAETKTISIAALNRDLSLYMVKTECNAHVLVHFSTGDDTHGIGEIELLGRS